MSLDRLWFGALPSGEMHNQQSANQQQSYAAAASHQLQPSHGHKKTPPAGVSDVDPPRMRFKISDRVVVFDKNDTPLHGTVRWAGRKNRIGRDLGEVHIGIEMVCVSLRLACDLHIYMYV